MKPKHEASSKLAASAQPAQPLSRHSAPHIAAQSAPAQPASAQPALTQYAFVQHAQHVPEAASGEPVLSPEHSGSGYESEAEDGQHRGFFEQGGPSVMSAAMPWHTQGQGQADQAPSAQAGSPPQEGHFTAQQSYAALHAMQHNSQPWLSETQHGLLTGTQHSRPAADGDMHCHAAPQPMWADQASHTSATGRYNNAITTSSADGFVWQPVHPRDRQSISLTAQASAGLPQQASAPHLQYSAGSRPGLADQSHRWQQGARQMQGLTDAQTRSQASLQTQAGSVTQPVLGSSGSWHDLQTAYAAAQVPDTTVADPYEPYIADCTASGNYALQNGTAAATRHKSQPAHQAPYAAGQHMPAGAPQGPEATSRYAAAYATHGGFSTSRDLECALQHDGEQARDANLWTAARNSGSVHQQSLDSLQEAAALCPLESSVVGLQAGTSPLQNPNQHCQVCVMRSVSISV